MYLKNLPNLYITVILFSHCVTCLLPVKDNSLLKHHRSKRCINLEHSQKQTLVDSIIGNNTAIIISFIDSTKTSTFFHSSSIIASAAIANAQYIFNSANDVGYLREDCNPLSFQDIKNTFEFTFNNIDSVLQNNLVILKPVVEVIDEVLSSVDNKIDLVRQEFDHIIGSIGNSSIKSTLESLSTAVQQFAQLKSHLRIWHSQTDYIFDLEGPSVLPHLRDFITEEENTLHTLLNKIINENYAIPRHTKDKEAFTALYALYYGTLTYISATFFLLKQYCYLANYHYEEGNIEEYNKYFSYIVPDHVDYPSYQQYQTALSSTNYKSLLNTAIHVFNTVQEKIFVTSHVHLYKPLSEKTNCLTLLKHQIDNMQLPLITDKPDKLEEPKFDKSEILIPIGRWVERVAVSYALQYQDGETYSKVGPWSDPVIVSRKANPFLSIPVDDKGRTRIIFRKFNSENPQLVGQVGSSQTEFRDIDRDLYNAASTFNDEKAVNETDILIRHGANVNTLFDLKRRVIHAAAKYSNTQLTRQFLIKNNMTDINARDKTGYTPAHIAAVHASDNFIRLLIEQNADLNARTDLEQLTPLHLAAASGYERALDALIKSHLIRINAREKNGFSPLHVAIGTHVSVVRNLLTNGRTDVNAKSRVGFTPLHLSVINNYFDITPTLLNSEVIDVNARTRGNYTALHFAAMLADPEIVNNLTKRKDLEVNARSRGGWSALHFAIALRREDVVAKLLKVEGINVNLIGEGKVTPLHVAVATGQEGVVTKLLEMNATLEDITASGLAPLHLASIRGNEVIIGNLTEKGANVEARTFEGNTPLHFAAAYLKLDTVKYLIENAQANFEVKDNSNQTALHFAAAEGKLDVVEYLVDQKADSNVVDSFGRTPLHLAGFHDHFAVVKYFIVDRGMSSGQLLESIEKGYIGIVKLLMVTGADPEEKDADGRTPLFEAVKHDRLNIVKYLIENGVKMDIRDHSGKHVMHIAAAHGQLNVIRYLIEERKADKNIPDRDGKTPLHYAVESGNLELVKYLVYDKGIDASTADAKGAVPLHYAISGTCGVQKGNRSIEIVQYLVEQEDADVNVRDHLDRTPLFIAAQVGNLMVMKYLIDKGAAVNVGNNKEGKSVLYVAAEKGHFDVVRYLVDGMKLNVMDRSKENDTAMHAAARNGKLNVVQFLMERGAEVNSAGKDGNSILHTAVCGSLETVEYLINRGADYRARNLLGQTPLSIAEKNKDNVLIPDIKGIIAFLRKYTAERK